MNIAAGSRKAFLVLVATVVVEIGLVVAFAGSWFWSSESSAQAVVEYDLEITGTDIDYGNGNVWHAWTFKNAGDPTGAVPGPTLTVNAGEKLVVHVKNTLDMTHSFHTHLSGYDQKDDGAQTNIISGVGTGAMIPAGGEWTYEFEPKEPGVYYYHCHSADGGLMITDHIHQGLYGAILVKDPEKKDVRDEVVFMAETGHLTEGDSVPTYLMNGLGLPGGEHSLEEAFLAGGIDAVAANFGTTVPVFNAKVGEKLSLNLINIGDQIHTFHPHNVDMFSQGVLGGAQWPANVVPLLPGAADVVTMTFEKPGLWLFHCHVVNHADAGMIGLFIVEEGEATSKESTGSGTGNVRPSSGQPPPAASPTAAGGSADSMLEVELSDFEIRGPDGGAIPALTSGAVEFHADNVGAQPHELVILQTDQPFDALPVDGSRVDEDAAGTVIGRIADIAGGADDSGTFAVDPGAYVLICNIPGHYGLGMRAPLTVQ